MRAFFVLASLCAVPLTAQFEKLGQQLGHLAKKLPVTEIALRTDPADHRVRPFETLVVQVLAYGKDGEQKVRLRRSEARLRVKEPDGGWLSKPFAFQGKDEEKFFDESKSAAWNIFASASGEYVIKDSVLYTAPEKAGKYRVEAELEGKPAEVEIEVTPDAASRRKPEKISFSSEARRTDPYRPLAEHCAPFLAQETWFQPKADTPSRFDFDGDWHGDNNWDALETGSSQAFVYYAAMETGTHWFIIYNVFHPRDYSDRCVVGTCHENDNEGIILTVLKDGSAFGRVQVMETLAHNNVYPVTADPAIRNGAHTIDSRIEFYEQTHPAVFIESGGHGIYGTRSANSRFSLERGEFQEGTGITLIYKGTPERPRHANDRLVGYELLPIYEEWWLKAEEGKWNDRTFDSYFRYQPFGGRPGVGASIGGAFFGRKESSNKAKPFWGWHDTLTLKKNILAVGQWGLDPAYAVSQNLRFPPGQPFSLDYVYNAYLGIDRREQKPAPEEPAATVAAPAAVTAPAPPQAEQGQGSRPLKPGFNLFSKEQDVQLGKEAAGQIEKEMTIISDPELNSYIRRIGEKLGATPEAAGFPYSFKIVSDNSINAFALPGGPTFIHTGLLAAADNEAQVAGVLAHEIAHVALRHGTNQASKANLIQLPAALAAAATGKSGSLLGGLAQLGIGLGANSVLLKFSRSAEQDADLLGTRIMARVGYSPVEMARFFQKLEAGGGGGRTLQFFSSHPNAGNRVKAVEAEIRYLPGRTYTTGDGGEFARMQKRVAALPPPPPRAKEAGGAPVPEIMISANFREYRSNSYTISYPDKLSEWGRAFNLPPGFGPAPRSTTETARAAPPNRPLEPISRPSHRRLVDDFRMGQAALTMSRHGCGGNCEAGFSGILRGFGAATPRNQPGRSPAAAQKYCPTRTLHTPPAPQM